MSCGLFRPAKKVDWPHMNDLLYPPEKILDTRAGDEEMQQRLKDLQVQIGEAKVDW
jgi:hypothetical protein